MIQNDMDDKNSIIKTIIDIMNGKESISQLLNKLSFQESTTSVSIVISSEVKDGQTNMYAINPKTLVYENKDYAVNLLYDENKNYIEITFLTNENNIGIIDEICVYYNLKIKIAFFGRGEKYYFLEPLGTSEIRDIVVLIDNNSEKNVQIKFSQNKDIQNYKNIKFVDILRINGINNSFHYLKTEGIWKIFFLLKLFFAMICNFLYLKIMNIFIKIETRKMIKRNKNKK